MLATIGGLVKPAAGAARTECPTLATEIPHRSVEGLRFKTTHSNEPTTRGTVGPRKNLFPGLAAIGSFINPALLVVIPQVTGSADVHSVTVLGIDQNFRNVLRILQANIGPVLPAVGGLVNSISNRNAVPNPRLAS